MISPAARKWKRTKVLMAIAGAVALVLAVRPAIQIADNIYRLFALADDAGTHHHGSCADH